MSLSLINWVYHSYGKNCHNEMEDWLEMENRKGSHFGESLYVVTGVAMIKMALEVMRCAEKLFYKRHKDKERLVKKVKENIKRKRKKYERDGDDSTAEEYVKSPDENKKGKTSSCKDTREDDDNDLDQFLEGMFP